MDDRLARLIPMLRELNEVQLTEIEKIARQFTAPYIKRERLGKSKIINDCLLVNLGDALRLHHCFSYQPLTKESFEYALERVGKHCKVGAKRAPPQVPHDITVNSIRYSLKTQADKDIRQAFIHISKFMELGKGQWTDKLEDLKGLRQQFVAHMASYDSVLVLRCLSKVPKRWHYELVEIPKSLLLEAQNGTLYFAPKSTQTVAKSGYCDVKDSDGALKFRLYFDGGGERKLQVQKIDKAWCVTHATWIFSTEESSQEPLLEIP